MMMMTSNLRLAPRVDPPGALHYTRWNPVNPLNHVNHVNHVNQLNP